VEAFRHRIVRKGPLRKLSNNVFVPFRVLHKDLHRHLTAVAVDCIYKA